METKGLIPIATLNGNFKDFFHIADFFIIIFSLKCDATAYMVIQEKS